MAWQSGFPRAKSAASAASNRFQPKQYLAVSYKKGLASGNQRGIY
jgi:hypothetical protein